MCCTSSDVLKTDILLIVIGISAFTSSTRYTWMGKVYWMRLSRVVGESLRNMWPSYLGL